MRIIALSNQKGGVAKSTSTVNIAAGLTNLKKKVGVIDMDPQGHAGKGLGIDVKELETTIFDVLTGEARLEDAVLDREGILVIPSNRSLSGLQAALGSKIGKEYSLKEALENSMSALGELDYLLIDTPPSLELQTINSFVAAKEIFVPVAAQYYALEGMADLIEALNVVKKYFNPELDITGVFGTLYNKQSRHHKAAIELLKDHFRDKVFRTAIRQTVSLQEAPSYGQTIFEYAPKSNNGCQDYLALCKEIIKKEAM